MKGLLKFITCGSVDDGKSTLIGHILYDSKLLYAGLEDGSMGNFYVSSDGGRNWVEQRSTYNAPGDMECDAFGMVADDDNFVWVVSAPGGKIVKGRLNRLSYEENPRIFK